MEIHLDIRWIIFFLLLALSIAKVMSGRSAERGEKKSPEADRTKKEEKSDKKALGETVKAMTTVIVAIVAIVAIGWGVKYFMSSVDASRAELARNSTAARTAFADSVARASLGYPEFKSGETLIVATPSGSGRYFRAFTARLDWQPVDRCTYHVHFKTMDGVESTVTYEPGRRARDIDPARWVEFISETPCRILVKSI